MLNRKVLGAGRQGQRTFNRLSLDMAGELELTRGTCRCTVQNISSTGARLSGDTTLERGYPVVLHVAERALFGTVIWARGSGCGVRFDNPVPLEEMQRFLWILQNRERYEAERQSSAAREWSTGQPE